MVEAVGVAWFVVEGSSVAAVEGSSASVWESVIFEGASRSIPSGLRCCCCWWFADVAGVIFLVVGDGGGGGGRLER